MNDIRDTICTILDHYSVHEKHNPIINLKNKLDKNYKNVILLILDGMGSEILKKNLSENDFLLRNLSESVNSVFPSTTTAAMTTYYSALPPVTHGWIAWSLFFKEYGSFVDIFNNFDSFTKLYIDTGEKRIADIYMPYESIFTKLKGKVETHFIMPEGVILQEGADNEIPVRELHDIAFHIAEICKNDKQNFIFAYHFEPDFTLHYNGCTSDKAKFLIKYINDLTEKLCGELNDSLVIITADHGHIDCNMVDLRNYPDICSCLIIPPTIDARVLSFYIKAHKKQEFEELFNKYFGEHHLLLNRDEFFEKNCLGIGEKHPRLEDFIGDYVAIGTGNTMIYYLSMKKNMNTYRSTHAGLTDDEMKVPLIMIEK